VSLGDAATKERGGGLDESSIESEKYDDWQKLNYVHWLQP